MFQIDFWVTDMWTERQIKEMRKALFLFVCLFVRLYVCYAHVSSELLHHPHEFVCFIVIPLPLPLVLSFPPGALHDAYTYN